MKAGIRLDTKFLGIVNLYAIGSLTVHTAPGTDTQMDMKVKSPALLVLLLLLAPLGTPAAELVPLLQEHRLGVTVLNARLPPTLRKDLASGLTNKILLRAVLLQGLRPPTRTQVAQIQVAADWSR